MHTDHAICGSGLILANAGSGVTAQLRVAVFCFHSIRSRHLSFSVATFFEHETRHKEVNFSFSLAVRDICGFLYVWQALNSIGGFVKLALDEILTHL